MNTAMTASLPCFIAALATLACSIISDSDILMNRASIFTGFAMVFLCLWGLERSKDD